MGPLPQVNKDKKTLPFPVIQPEINPQKPPSTSHLDVENKSNFCTKKFQAKFWSYLETPLE